MTKSGERPKAGLAKSKAKAVVPGSAVKVPATIDEAALLGDLRTLVQSARQRIATAAYSTQTLLCWHMGRRLASEHLQGGRAAYGKQILVTLSQQFSWSHFHALLPIKDPLARDFYAEMCCIERCDVRTLRPRTGISVEIDGGRFEWAVLNPPKLSTALREVQPQSEQHFHGKGELRPVATHKECLSVRREGALHAQRRAGKRICVTAARELIADIGCYFKPELGALLEGAPS